MHSSIMKCCNLVHETEFLTHLLPRSHLHSLPLHYCNREVHVGISEEAMKEIHQKAHDEKQVLMKQAQVRS